LADDTHRITAGCSAIHVLNTGLFYVCVSH